MVGKKISVLPCLILTLICMISVSDEFTIVLSEKPSPQEEYAAKELKHHLGKYAEVGIAKTAENTKGKIIYLCSAGNRRNQINPEEMDTEEWHIQALNHREITISGGSPRGIIYGAYEFLERFAGVIWMDEFSTYIPEKEIQWDRKTDLRGKPSFAWRSIYTYFSGKQSRIEFACRNRQNYFLNEKISEPMRERGLTPLYGSPRSCHSFHDYVRSWGEDVPMEYFSLSAKQGKRVKSTSPLGPGQVCLSHPDVRKKFIASLREFIKKDRKEAKSSLEYPAIYDISANDNYDPCICPLCRENVRRYGNYTGLTINFINEIARAVKKEYPDIKIQFFAYYFTQDPPHPGTKIESNVIVRIAQMGSEFDGKRIQRDSMRSIFAETNKKAHDELIQWSSFAKLAVWDYWIVFRSRGDLTENTAAIASNLQFYRDKADILFAECERPLEVSFHALRVWLGYRLMNDASLDPKQETEKFMKAYYGPAVSEMREYMALIQNENSKVSGILSIPVSNRIHLDAEFFKKAELLLEQAESKSADNPDLLRRIKRERIVCDLARIKHWRLPADLKPESSAVKKRLHENISLLAPYYFGSRAQSEIKNLKKQISRQRPSNHPHPDFPKRKVIAYYAGTALDGSIVSDSESPVKYACILGKNVQHTTNPLAGFYDITNSRTITFPGVLKNITDDEKYHWYRIGIVSPAPKCYLFLHKTWQLQKQLDELYGFSSGKTAEIFCRIKFTGPAYVSDSKNTNGIFLSEVIVLETQQ